MERLEAKGIEAAVGPKGAPSATVGRTATGAATFAANDHPVDGSGTVEMTTRVVTGRVKRGVGNLGCQSGWRGAGRSTIGGRRWAHPWPGPRTPMPLRRRVAPRSTPPGASGTQHRGR